MFDTQLQITLLKNRIHLLQSKGSYNNAIVGKCIRRFRKLNKLNIADQCNGNTREFDSRICSSNLQSVANS